MRMLWLALFIILLPHVKASESAPAPTPVKSSHGVAALLEIDMPQGVGVVSREMAADRAAYVLVAQRDPQSLFLNVLARLRSDGWQQQQGALAASRSGTLSAKYVRAGDELRVSLTPVGLSNLFRLTLALN